MHPNYRWLLEEIEKGEPRVHATGFAQLYLKPGVRLHVWSERLMDAAPDIKQIVFKHDHRYGIKSFVIHGILHDQASIWDYYGASTPWRMWEVRPAGQGLPEKPHPITEGEGRGDLMVCEEQPRIITSGQEYRIPKRTFHATRAVGTTVTMMRKLDEEDAWARLLVPKGYDPIHSLSQQPDMEFIKREMRAALRLCSKPLIDAAFEGVYNG